MTTKTLHLMTQRGQPYGSRRRCCENCGLMLVARPPTFWQEHAWVDAPDEYKNQSDEDGVQYETCSTARVGADL